MLDLISKLNDKIENQPDVPKLQSINDFPYGDSYPHFLPKGSKWNLVYHRGYNELYFHDKDSSLWLSSTKYHQDFHKISDVAKQWVAPYLDQYFYIESVLIYTKNELFFSIGHNIPMKLKSGNFDVNYIVIPGEISLISHSNGDIASATIAYRLIG